MVGSVVDSVKLLKTSKFPQSFIFWSIMCNSGRFANTCFTTRVLRRGIKIIRTIQPRVSGFYSLRIQWCIMSNETWMKWTATARSFLSTQVKPKVMWCTWFLLIRSRFCSRNRSTLFVLICKLEVPILDPWILELLSCIVLFWVFFKPRSYSGIKCKRLLNSSR
jgi:hypothetical protein